MTIPVRPLRPVRRDRRFDLRTTTWFFVLLALVLCLLALVVRLAAHVVEQRPLWAAVLALLAVSGVLLWRPGRGRLSARRCARRAARALEAGAEAASDSLHLTPVVETAVPDAGGCLPTAVLPDTIAAPDGDGEAPTILLDSHDAYAELDPYGFEQAIAELCVREGCGEVEVVGGAGDLGADVLAVTAEGLRVVIQCKQYGDTNKVGSQDMQRFGGTCFTIHEADVAALVTTSEFTAPALDYARQCGIVCVDGVELEAWRRGTGMSPWDPRRPDVS
ncbi:MULTISPECIES: restriction endonuclease [unclassified Streptomyces]|uniref:restriction endonuclease n=1 Tax=unclassified Streptomyces TaxID=2593676 RepID=UPI000DC59E5C|nr:MULTISPECIES: restriction endonuclease [unclassified Streptomyces]RAJ55559.1 restriction system protein [Streptomyces sp. PsTaAH-130]